MSGQSNKKPVNKVLQYLKKKQYEIVKASEPGKHLVFIPYAEHSKVHRHLKKQNISHTLRFNHDYSTAIYCL